MKIRRLTRRKQTRLDVLMDKNNDGQLTREERVELEELVKEAEGLTLANAREVAGRHFGNNHERS